MTPGLHNGLQCHMRHRNSYPSHQINQMVLRKWAVYVVTANVHSALSTGAYKGKYARSPL